MIVLAYAASLLIGLSLGLLGGGGSILTLPVLVYLFGVATVDATAYSLFIVGATALASSAAIVPLAPVRFSTTTGWPNASVILLANSRPTTSVGPPGG